MEGSPRDDYASEFASHLVDSASARAATGSERLQALEVAAGSQLGGETMRVGDTHRLASPLQRASRLPAEKKPQNGTARGGRSGGGTMAPGKLNETHQ